MYIKYLTYIILCCFVFNFCKESKINDSSVKKKEHTNLSTADKPLNFLKEKKFDSIKLIKLDYLRLDSTIQVYKFHGFTNDFVYKGLISKKSENNIDSIAFLHTKINKNSNQPCYYGWLNFYNISQIDYFCYFKFDTLKSCSGGLGKQYAMSNYYYKINQNGYFTKVDTVLNNYPCKWIGECK